MALNRTSVETIEIRVDGEERVAQAYDKIGNSQDKLKHSTNAATEAQKKQQRAAATTTQRMAAIGGAAMAAQIAVMALARAMQMVKAPIGIAKDFEKEFAMIRTLNYDIGKTLRDDLLNLAAKIPQSISDLTKSAYQDISAGVSKEDNPDFIKAASNVATGAAATMTESVEVLSAAVNAFGEQGITASKAADILFATQRQGVTTVRQLGQSFGYVAPMAKFGVSMEEATAAIAAMTKIGMSTAAAVTRLQGAINTLAKPASSSAKQ